MLHRKTRYDPTLKTILVYPSAYTLDTKQHRPGGSMEAARALPNGARYRDWGRVLGGE